MKFILSTLAALTIFMSCSTNPNNNGGTNTTVIPIAPSNLTGVVISNSRVNLSWTDNSTNETGFKIERRLDGGNYTVIGTVNADILNYSDSGLLAYTNYTYRVYSYNAVGNSITYSNEFSISTGGVPVLSTNTISTVTFTTAVSGGNITSDGGTSVTVRGVVWSTTSNPTINLSTKTTDGNGTGVFNSNISGLNANTTYYLRAYATNANGTGYGNQQIFITNNYVIPSITTTAISSIGTTTAISGGDISNDGGMPVSSRGVVWSTSSSPTIALSTKTIDGTGPGTFTSNIIGLVSNSTYYVRAYATNSVGTAYGNEQIFTTTQVYSYTPGPNVTDVNGNVYPSITTSCGQTWTTKNLNVTSYRNGDTIPKVTDPIALANSTIGAWCYYNYDAANGPIYGKLYNWYAVNDPRGLAPQGWHVPSASEWNKFIKCIDPAADTTSNNIQSVTAGGAMKEAGTSHWLSPNIGASNSSGFSGLPGGNRILVFDLIRYAGYWWCSTELDISYAKMRVLDNQHAYVGWNNNPKTSCFSVRLVKD